MTSTRLEQCEDELRGAPRTWLVTGVAGFIGSNLAERLLQLGQNVVGLDDFSTGYRHNLDDVLTSAGAGAAAHFRFLDGDIRDLEACRRACRGVDYVLHQAALGSVPRSIDDPLASHLANVDGCLHVLLAARDAGVRRLVYASSSAVYGDHPALPKHEDEIGRPLSPYAVTKRVNELYAAIVQDIYGLESIGLRYFNVFGPRQDPQGAYAAVIPRWIQALLAGDRCEVYGDGETSRDFCYVDDTVQANILAAMAPPAATNQVYNVGCREATTLSRLFVLIRDRLAERRPELADATTVLGPARPGDVRHSLADITPIRDKLGYVPRYTVESGLAITTDWFADRA